MHYRGKEMFKERKIIYNMSNLNIRSLIIDFSVLVINASSVRKINMIQNVQKYVNKALIILTLDTDVYFLYKLSLKDNLTDEHTVALQSLMIRSC